MLRRNPCVAEKIAEIHAITTTQDSLTGRKNWEVLARTWIRARHDQRLKREGA